MSKCGIKNLAAAASLAALGAASAAADTPTASHPETLGFPEDILSVPLTEVRTPLDIKLARLDQAIVADGLRFGARVTADEQQAAQREKLFSAFVLDSSLGQTDLHVATVDLFAPEFRKNIERAIRRGNMSSVTTFPDLKVSRNELMVRFGQFSAPVGEDTTLFGSMGAGVRVTTIFSGATVKGQQGMIMPSPSSQVFGQSIQPMGSITLGATHFDQYAHGSRELSLSASFGFPFDPIQERGFMTPRDNDGSVSVSAGLNFRF